MVVFAVRSVCSWCSLLTFAFVFVARIPARHAKQSAVLCVSWLEATDSESFVSSVSWRLWGRLEACDPALRCAKDRVAVYAEPTQIMGTLARGGVVRAVEG